MAAGVLVGFMVEQPSKREMREELTYQKERNEKKAKLYTEHVDRLNTEKENLQKQVAFYKAECGYYKKQAEKNLALLQRATALNSKQGENDGK
jgi:uncharacterized protein YlxW (UPF0749 family)